jgi:hypothetical protein
MLLCGSSGMPDLMQSAKPGNILELGSKIASKLYVVFSAYQAGFKFMHKKHNHVKYWRKYLQDSCDFPLSILNERRDHALLSSCK